MSPRLKSYTPIDIDFTMEALKYGGLVGLCYPPTSLTLPNTRIKPFPSPSLSPSSPSFRPRTLAVSAPGPHDYPNTTTCHSSKWADRLLGDFHFLPTTETSSSPSDSTLTSLLPPPLAALEPPPQRKIALPIDFYQVLSHLLVSFPCVLDLVVDVGRFCRYWGRRPTSWEMG